ncbi:MAG TPA: carboxypeptidase-like regulatory domain-containing protein [Gemmatimonadaceae bacterium]
MRILPRLAAAIVLLFASAPHLTAQTPPSPPPTRHEVIRGVVTTGGRALDGVDVIATRAPDRAFKSAKTDASGHYLIDWPDGTGDYLVHVASVGYETMRRRVTRTGADSILVVDVALQPSVQAQQLGPVVTTARKPKPDRNPDFGAGVGASEQLSGGLNGKLAPDQAGDLSALAATLPGVSQVPGGISVLGLPPDQNSTTLNGMAFAGADVPRDANTRLRVSSSAYDPSRGWFSGANSNVELAPGNLFGGRRSHITLDAPTLQYTDPISARLGQRFTSGQLSYGADGELIEDKWYYNIGLQGGRRNAPQSSLGTADADLLRAAGVSSDSATRLLATLAAAGVPVATPSFGTSLVSDNASFIGRFDRKPYDPKTLAASRSTWGITTYAKYGKTSALGISPTTTAAHGGENTQMIGSAQALYSTYFGDDYLADLKSGFSYTHNRATPFLEQPDGRVRVQSDFNDLAGAAPTLSFGGNGAIANDATQWTWESSADVQLYARSTPAHRIKLSGDVRLDGFTQDATPNANGTFFYNSIGDVQAGTPASFSRTLSSPGRSGMEWNAFGAASDLWRINPAWQVMYGARLEGNVFADAPAYNPEVDRLFGARTDYTPTQLHISPRFGFNYNRSGQVRNSTIANPLGRFNGTTPGVLRGGVGEFRSFTPPALISNAIASTGLSGAESRVACLGAGVPTPDWSTYIADAGAIPTQCTNGAALVDAAPNVSLLDKSWNTPRSWRGNLAWQSVLGGFNYSVEGIYSLNLDQPALYDLNFNGTQRFALPDEGRAMFVNPSSIVAASGAVSPLEARTSSEFGRVLSARGDGRSISRQATVTIAPNLVGGGLSNFYVSGAYTLASNRARHRGFDGTTFDSPTASYWTRGDLDARHQFLLQGGYNRGPFTLSLFGRLQSGLAFTPIVGSDVNGDGAANDRAFIFDPAKTRDAALGRSLTELIAASQGNVRSCLERQLGRAATPQSCESPWVAALNARLGIVGDGKLFSRRVDIGLNFANPLGGLDQLLHGDNHLHGWGTPAAPDPVLFNVRGWDAPSQSFAYTVNPRFGNTRPTATTLRAPFRVTLDVSVDVGRPIQEQQVDRWLKPGRSGRSGVKADAQDLKRRYDRNVPDLYAQVLQQTDSLLLSREQVEALQKARAEYRVHLDSIWSPLATYLAALPDVYDSRAAYRHAEDATDAAWEVTRVDLQRTLPNMLNKVQLELLPPIVKTVYTAKEPLHIRIFIVGG